MHRFLDNGISREDISEILRLTKEGKLIWSLSDGFFAINAHPAIPDARRCQSVSDKFIGENLSGIRIGFNPELQRWHYMRLTDSKGKKWYIEDQEHLMASVDQLVSAIAQLSTVDSIQSLSAPKAEGGEG